MRKATCTAIHPLIPDVRSVASRTHLVHAVNGQAPMAIPYSERHTDGDCGEFGLEDVSLHSKHE